MSWLPIVDGHADTLTRLEAERRMLGERAAVGHSDLGRLLEAGVALQVLAICVEQDREPESGLRRTLLLLERFIDDISGRGEAFAVETRADLDRLGPGRVGFILGLEGAAPLGGRPELLRTFFRLGIRLLGLVWNGRNDFADGVMVAGGGGLTGAGRALIARAEELGVVVDLSHLNEAGFWDALSVARKPLAVTHANAKALCDHPRNLSDAQLRGLSAQGGVVGIGLYPPFLTLSPPATMDDVLRHLDHLLTVAGPGAVGLGLDYDGIETTPRELPDISALPRLIAALARLNLDDGERAAVLGGNWLRLFRQILP